MLPPSLSRAISDSTSPFGAFPPPECLRNLEVYLADPRSTDAVYEGLVNRACSDPVSVPLVEKVVALLKAYLFKYTPSQDAVQLLEEFSYRVQELPGLSAAGRKAVQFVLSVLRRLPRDRAGGLNNSRASLGSLAGAASGGSSLRGSWGRSREDLTRLGPDGRIAPVKVNVSSSALGRTNDRYAAVDALPSPTDPEAGGAGTAAIPAWLRESGGRGWEDLRVPSAQQAAQGVEPSWAVPARPHQLPPPPLGATAARARSWMQHLPDLAPRVAIAPLSGSGTASGTPYISLNTIHHCVLDIDEQDMGRHLAEVLGEARVEAQQLQPPTPQQRQHPARAGGRNAHHGAGGGKDGMAARRSRPARLLFHHPPYNRSERLSPIDPDVVEAVVEAVCGVRAASALSAVQGPPGVSEAEETAAGQPEGIWQAAFEEDGDFGQVCGSILMKLIVDLWTSLGAAGSYTLVLRMLRAALRSGQPSTRARAFDVVYNLSVHGAMLRSNTEEAALAAAAAAGAGGGVGGMQLPWQVCASAPVSPFISGGGGLTPPPAARPLAAMTPVGSTPPAPTHATTTAGDNGAASAIPRHVISHSLGLSGSALLDTGGSLAGMAAGTLRSGSKGAGKVPISGSGSSGAANAGTAVADGGDGLDGSEATRPAPSDSPEGKAPPQHGGAAAAAGAATAGSVGSSGGGGVGSATGYDRWLRALLFQLLCDLCEGAEYSAEVWRAAMGCTSHLCSHGGYWVAAWVQHLPPAALAGLLRAACNLSWSQELYAHLLRLIPHVLIKTPSVLASQQYPQQNQQGVPPSARRPESAFAAPAALSAATAAAEDTAAAAAAAAATDGVASSHRLAAFGGLEELLFHFMRAPTPDSRASLLTALAYCCGGGSEAAGGLSVSSSGERISGLPSPSGPAGSGSPGSRLQDTGPATALALLQGLHLDSVCLALRAGLQRPWLHMSSRLADVLASASAVLDMAGPAFGGLVQSPAASVSGSADYGATAASTLPAGVASPIAARALLRPLLESLEMCCADSMMSPQSGELRKHMDVTEAHIGGGGSLPVPPPPLTAAGVKDAWRCFMQVCSEETAEARHIAIHWLHKLLSAACRACQGQLPLLSPLSLKSSLDASKLFAAAAAPAAQPHAPPLPRWNVALADALLHVVREAPRGCELLMAAINRVVADIKAAAAVNSVSELPMSPRFAGLQTASVAAAAAAAAAGEEAALMTCRRVMWLYYVALQWMLQCSSAEARMPSVVELADTVLTALLEPDPAITGAAAGAAAAAVTAGVAAGVAAAVAAAVEKPPQPPAHGVTGTVRGSGHSGRGGSILSQLQLPQLHTHAMSHSGSTALVAAAAAAAAATGAAAAQQPQAAAQPEPGGGMLISQQLLAGLLALDPEALACTPPELLVVLLQQCSQNLQDSRAGPTAASLAADNGVSDVGDGVKRTGGGYGSMQRGFVGRPCAVVGAMPSGTAASAASSTGLSRLGTSFTRASTGSGVSGNSSGEGALSGAAVGPWQDDWQDRRLALLLLLMARCSLDPEAFAKYSLSHVIKAQLGCEDLRCRYYAGVYLLKHWMLNQHDKYWRTLRHIIGTAQQLNDERLLDNPYLQMRTMLNVDHA